MVMFLFLKLLLLFQLGVLGGGDECMPASCGHKAPVIRFPFWLKDHQPRNCGYPDPAFTLSCSPNGQTLLQLVPFSLNLSVRKINYQFQQLTYNKSIGGCLRLTQLHSSDFDHSRGINDISIFSSPKAYNIAYPCLSSPVHHVYAVPSDVSIKRDLLSCTKMHDISYISYSLLRSITSVTKKGRFDWSYPNCHLCEYKGKYCRLRNNSTNETECFPKPPPTDGYTNITDLMITGVISVGAFLLLVDVVLCFVITNKVEREDQVMIEKFLEDYRALKPTRCTYTEIKKITDQFKDELGQGGYGRVYKGKLPNDVDIAAKVLNNFKGNGDDFINEVRTIGTIHHVNVVRLVGYCADGYKRALVYEYLPNNSLEKFISSDEKRRSLGWGKLQDIALGIAKGIEYLHQGCDKRILHFDIKPHNILLDHNFNPKISDFGLAKLCSKEQSVVSMTAARGTVGYIAPEVLSRNFGNVSHKSDVYSFGMLLLEMVGGRKNTDVTIHNTDEVYFPEWIYNRLNREEENGNEIEEDGDAKIVKKLTVVGLWCIQWYPGSRPSIKGVVQMLEGDGSTLAMPPSPFFATNASTSRENMGESSFSSKLADISECE